MSKVEPIRDQREIQRIEDELLRIGTEKSLRMFCMFETGIYLGLRIGDMLKLRVGDIRGKQDFTFFPEKTSHRAGRDRYRAKKITVTIAPELRRMVREMYDGYDDNDFMFESRQTDSGRRRPISRGTAWRDMKEIQQMIGLKYPIGCHTLRKTFGYHVYQDRHDIAWLQSWFQHSSPAITLIYIGIADDEKKAVTDHMPYRNRGRLNYASAQNQKKFFLARKTKENKGRKRS